MAHGKNRKEAKAVPRKIEARETFQKAVKNLQPKNRPVGKKETREKRKEEKRRRRYY